MRRYITQVGKQTSKGHKYPRLTLTGYLEDIGIEIGDEVVIEVTREDITIRPKRPKNRPDAATESELVESLKALLELTQYDYEADGVTAEEYIHELELDIKELIQEKKDV